MRIVGIVLVRDEERFVERALRNVVEFCDELIVCDHGSRDATPGILADFAAEFSGKVTVHSVRRPGESHRLIERFAGTDAWVFGVDGDEIYDPAGLRRFRRRLEAGEFDKWWVVFGNVLNVVELGEDSATGHLAPPCRSMTKLYNFAAIERWDGGDIVERLHGGDIRFREGRSESDRCALHESAGWDDADFRCLHFCFLERSSVDAAGGPRKNIMDRHAWTAGKMLSKAKGLLAGRGAPDWKEEKYARGPVVTKRVGEFFPKGA